MEKKMLVGFIAGWLTAAFSLWAGEVKETPFDVGEVIERISNNQISTSPWMGEDKNGVWANSGEFLIDTNVIYVPAPEEQGAPAVAFDGTNYLVVWGDANWVVPCASICGARVTKSGEILDIPGFVISKTGGAYPDVIFDGKNYFVVWGKEHDRDGVTWDIYGARVTPGGAVLDTAGIVISNTFDNQQSPSVAFDGTNYFVVWNGYRIGSPTGYDIYGARVSSTGILLDTESIAISTAESWQLQPTISFDGADYFVVWGDNRNGLGEWDIYGARVTKSGIVLDTAGIAVSTAANGQNYPALSFDGTNYLVAWGDARTGEYRIYGSRVSKSGIVLDPSGFAIATEPAADYGNPRVGFDGINYFVVWPVYRSGGLANIYGARVSRDGIVLDPEGIEISTTSAGVRNPSIACDGINHLVVWDSRADGGPGDIYGIRVNKDGILIDSSETIISVVANEQYNPGVIWGGGNYLIVWEDNSYCDAFRLCPSIHGARINPEGVTVDPRGIDFPHSPGEFNQVSPAIAYDSINYFVVWQQSNFPNLIGARVTSQGILLDSSGIALCDTSQDPSNPAIAFDGKNYTVVWSNFSWADHPYQEFQIILGTRVTMQGMVLNPLGFEVSNLDKSINPGIAFDGSNYLVVWQNYNDVYCGRVNTAGEALDFGGIVISNASGNQEIPSVCFDGTNYFVVWQDSRSGYFNIYGARISKGGVVLDSLGILISAAVDTQASPSVSFNGVNYLVVWQDNRNGDWDIYGALVSPAGVVIDSFPVSTQPGDQIEPAIARGPSGQMLIVWSGWTPEINGKSANTMRIWGKFYPFTGIGEDAGRSTQEAGYAFRITPNIFHNYTTISYSLPPVSGQQSALSLKIYGVGGRLVKQFNLLTNQPVNQITWDGRDEAGISLGAGVYFCRLTAGEYKRTEKLLIVK